ncbi:L,D-transpeptidase [Neobacillus sp. D3-1R]|uniref:L,D-transpeptidase n=1 Tax=Neobacillus sp. D3-1R TaxID=3445778 RepID=UPI003FA12ACC
MLKRIVIFLIIFSFGVLNAPVPSEGAVVKDQLIIINKKTNQLAFFENGKLIKTYSVATGKTSKLTPEGSFYIREKIKNRPYYKLGIKGGDPKNPLGDRWLGLSVKEKGAYPYAIHGNNNENSIGKYVSAGCIRMHNKDVRNLYEKIQTKTKVVITSSKESFAVLAQPHLKKVVAKK